MTQRDFGRTIRIVLATGVLAALSGSAAGAQAVISVHGDSYPANNRPSDPRFKADILVVLAHPDDESMVAAYVAREVFDQHKRVAVVYGTHGDTSRNAVGPEVGAVIGDIREMEARRAQAVLGVTNVWFLTGSDTPTENVLKSLEHWDHANCLGELVRIVRLTRPSVIIALLPDFTTGENHGDHQAAGVLATEAFDLAGDPTAFPEQVSPTDEIRLTEGLRPWQPEKIYYAYNPTHDIYTGHGPQYSAMEISPSKHISYGTFTIEAFFNHQTQGGKMVEDAFTSHEIEPSRKAQLPPGTPEPVVREQDRMTDPVKFIFGKSLVPSGVTDDIFTGVVEDGIPFHRAPGYTPIERSQPVLEIGDPWNFYHMFWQAHGLDHMADVVPPEITVSVNQHLEIPLIVENPLDKAIDVNLSVQAPDGWNAKPVSAVSVPARGRYFLRVLALAPGTKATGWQPISVSARSGDLNLGTVTLRTEFSQYGAMPQ